jgi:hypothetical protein
MGRLNLGSTPGLAEERFQRNVELVRALVDAGSPSIVRDRMEGRAISAPRRKFPLPDIGYRSGKLTVTGYIAGTNRGVSNLIVKCDCGRPEYSVAHNNFKNFKSTRCNLCALEKSHDTYRKSYWVYADAMADDAHRERLLNRLSAAISRCHNETNRAYPSYGGRGIFVCQQWRDDKRDFLRHVQTLSGWDNPDLEMDRADNNKGYEPGNIRFVPRGENVKNRRKIPAMQSKIQKLEEEIANLRLSISRAEE